MPLSAGARCCDVRGTPDRCPGQSSMLTPLPRMSLLCRHWRK